MLFATTEAVTETAALLPPDWYRGPIVSTIFFLLALVFLAVGYKVIDWITPGCLSGQLLGTVGEKKHTPSGEPNLALGAVVGFMFLGLCIIIAAAIH
jgi:hypothetical protein